MSARQPLLIPGSCLPSASLSTLTVGTNVVAYVSKSHWNDPDPDTPVGTPGVAVANIEGSYINYNSGHPPIVPTGNDLINSCASEPTLLETVCTANSNAVYVIAGQTPHITNTLHSSGMDTSFSMPGIARTAESRWTAFITRR